MKTDVYYTSSFVPAELITACGCTPKRLSAAFETGRFCQTEGMCAFTQGWLETLLSQGQNETFITVFATCCDQMRRAYDLYCKYSRQPAILLNVPSMNTPNALDYYQQELQRLQQFLCSVSEKDFDRDRLITMMVDAGQIVPSKHNHQFKITITGESVSESIHATLSKILEASNVDIVLDTTNDKIIEHFLKFDQKLILQEPLAALADSYFQLPAVWKRPNDYFYRRLLDKIRTNDLNGIILLRYIFCDLWHSAAYELKKRLAVPVLEIDLDTSTELSASAVSRIQAFGEMLRQ